MGSNILAADHKCSIVVAPEVTSSWKKAPMCSARGGRSDRPLLIAERDPHVGVGLRLAFHELIAGQIALMGSNRRNTRVLMSLANAPKAIKDTLLNMFETRSGTMVRVSSVATRKTAPTRAHRLQW
jgi:hypothetical protein